jgi:oligoendopeptidase F
MFMSVSLKSSGGLPTWDLSDLYAGPTDPALDADFAWARGQAEALVAEAEGKLAGLASPDFAAVLKRYEALDERLGKIGSYAQLLYAQDMSNPDVGRFYQSVQERITEIASRVLFFRFK